MIVLGSYKETMMIMPGFRFHPTEEELVGLYLAGRVVEGLAATARPSFIPHLHLYDYDPWELEDFAETSEKMWYFFVPRNNTKSGGGRSNRRTKSGYWKATGIDKTVSTNWDMNSRIDKLITTTSEDCLIGLKKTLVFYKGRAPKGVKTNWIMNEFRLSHLDHLGHCHLLTTKEDLQSSTSLCKVYRKVVPLSLVAKEKLPIDETSMSRSSDETSMLRTFDSFTFTNSGITSDHNETNDSISIEGPVKKRCKCEEIKCNKSSKVDHKKNGDLSLNQGQNIVDANVVTLGVTNNEVIHTKTTNPSQCESKDHERRQCHQSLPSPSSLECNDNNGNCQSLQYTPKTYPYTSVIRQQEDQDELLIDVEYLDHANWRY